MDSDFSRLIADLNHEVRNAIMSIKAMVILFGKRYPFSKDEQLAVENINAALARIEKAVNRITDELT